MKQVIKLIVNCGINCVIGYCAVLIVESKQQLITKFGSHPIRHINNIIISIELKIVINYLIITIINSENDRMLIPNELF